MVPQHVEGIEVEAREDDQVDDRDHGQHGRDEPRHQPAGVRALRILAFEELRGHRLANPLNRRSERSAKLGFQACAGPRPASKPAPNGSWLTLGYRDWPTLG